MVSRIVGVISFLCFWYVVLVYFLGVFYKSKSKDVVKLKNIIVLVPAHNEEHRIERLLKSIKSYGLRALVVLDKCTDNTNDVVKRYGFDVLEVAYKNKDSAVKHALSYLFKEVPGLEGVLLLDSDNEVGAGIERAISCVDSDSIYIIKTEVKGSNLVERLSGYIHYFFMRLNSGFMVLFGRCMMSGYGVYIPMDLVPAYVGYECLTLTEDIERLKLRCKFVNVDNGVSVEYPGTVWGVVKQRLRWFIGTYKVFFYRIKDIVKTFYLLPLFVNAFLLPIGFVSFLVNPLLYLWNVFLVSPVYLFSGGKVKWVDVVAFPFFVLLLAFVGVVSVFIPERWYSVKKGVVYE